MKKARLMFFGFVLACGAGAAWLALDRPEPQPAALAPAPPPPQLEQVLVAARELSFGAVTQATDLAWRNWPKDALPPGVIRRSDSPNAIEDIKDSVVRGSFLAGEPIRREKLIKGGGSGYLSAILAPGYRAVAIAIDGAGATTAGNFILPNDRVDVIRIYRDEDAVRSGAGDAFVSETLVGNVRVLAIGQNAQEKGGQPIAAGTTATLELDPGQAETVILAQKIGQLSLVLRSMQDSLQVSRQDSLQDSWQDAQQPGGPVALTQIKREQAVTVVRAGAASQSRGK
jgi:pilus assembly protein CpaB